MTGYYDARIFDWDESDAGIYNSAYGKAREWDYNTDARIGLGIMYRRTAPIFEENYPVPEPLSPEKRSEWVKHFMEERA